MHVSCRYGPCEIADLQERMKRAVALLGEEEVKNIMRDEGKIEVGLHARISQELCTCSVFAWMYLQRVCMQVGCLCYFDCMLCCQDACMDCYLFVTVVVMFQSVDMSSILLHIA